MLKDETDCTLSDLVASLPLADTIANPYPLYARLREETPIFGYRDYPPGTVPGQDEPVAAWVLMKYADVHAAALDHETFSSRDPLQEQSSAPSLMLVNHDNPEHDRLRQYVSAPFAFRQIEHLKPWITQRIVDMLEDFEGEVEVVKALTSIVPARVMMRLLGQPDEDALRCRDWANAFMLSADLSAEQRAASNQELAAYFFTEVAARSERLQQGTSEQDAGLIQTLLTAEVEGERLTLDEVVRFCLTLVVAGAETTTFLLTNLLYNLVTLPEVAARLRADQKLVLPFINETLRHSGPPQRLFRVATRDVTYGDTTIRQGDWVALFFAAANHDPAVFPEPDRFDLSRKNLRQQLSMGGGLHQCLGFALAKMEAAALIEVVLQRYPSLCLGEAAPTPQTASLLTHGYTELTLKF